MNSKSSEKTVCYDIHYNNILEVKVNTTPSDNTTVLCCYLLAPFIIEISFAFRFHQNDKHWPAYTNIIIYGMGI
jgi:hypothetical protein